MWYSAQTRAGELVDTDAPDIRTGVISLGMVRGYPGSMTDQVWLHLAKTYGLYTFEPAENDASGPLVPVATFVATPTENSRHIVTGSPLEPVVVEVFAGAARDGFRTSVEVFSYRSEDGAERWSLGASTGSVCRARTETTAQLLLCIVTNILTDEGCQVSTAPGRIEVTAPGRFWYGDIFDEAARVWQRSTHREAAR